MKPSAVYMLKWIKNHWSRWWLVAWSVPNHYLNQWWNCVNWAFRNKFQWNVIQNSHIYILENTCGNVVYEMAAISCRPQCVIQRSDEKLIDVYRLWYLVCTTKCCLFRRRSNWTWRLTGVTGLCEGNPSVTSNAEDVSIWWRHHDSAPWWQATTSIPITSIYIQWNLSVTTTSIIKFITCDLFSYVI